MKHKNFKSVLIALLLGVSITSWSQTITSTFAGNGTTGYSGDGGLATAAEFRSPGCVAFNTSGNLYIGDRANYVVREVNTSGIISTFAGNGYDGPLDDGGYSGDGGPATAAELSSPSSVAVDASGNLYIADEYNNVIREVNTSGIINTIAGNGYRAGTDPGGYSGDGGPATAAEFDYTSSVALDVSGNLYIADIFNCRIREVNTSGIINTIAGNGTAGYSGDGGPATAAEVRYPAGIAVDASGNVYIADESNSVIRKVNTSGVISTFAGNGTVGYSGDGGPATAAELHSPTGVAVDASGNVYIADESNSVIREVNISGVISTNVGNGIADYSGDGGPATAAELHSPTGIAVNTSGNVYIADESNNRIREVTIPFNVSVSVTANVSCTGGNNGSLSVMIFRGTPPYTYSWSGGNGTNSTATGLSAGTYTITVKDFADSTGSAIINIPQPTALSATTSVIANACYNIDNGNASASPVGGGTPYTYSWSNGTTTNSTGNVLSPGTYTATITDNCGVSVTASITITQPPTSVSTTASVLANACNGTSNGNVSANPSGGTIPYTYSWSNGITTNPTGAILSAGNYTVTVQDNCGASATASLSILQSPVMTATASVTSSPILCNGASTGAALAGATGGVSPYTYSWSKGGGTNAAITSYFVVATETFPYPEFNVIQTYTVPVGVTQVSITIIGAAGGFGNNTTTHIGGPGAGFTGVASVTPGHILGIVTGSMGGPGTAESDGGGGGGGSYVWDENTTTLIAVAAGGGGDYWNGTVGVAGAGGTNLTTNAATNGVDDYNAAGGTGGNGGAGVNDGNGEGAGGAGWLSNGGSSNGSPAYGGNDMVNGFTGGAGDVGNVGIDNGGYGGGGGGGYDAGGGGGGYNGGGGGLDQPNGGGGGGGSYFNTAFGTLPDNTVDTNTSNGSVTIAYTVSSGTGIVAGTYSVTVTDNNGCTSTASVTITQPNALSATASVTAGVGCSGSNGIVSAHLSGGTSPYTYSWSEGEGTNATASGVSAGAYTVTVTDNCDASATASVTITQPAVLSDTALTTNVSCNGGDNGSALVNPTGGISPYAYSWSNGATTSSTGAILSAGAYTVTVTSNSGCAVTTSVTITQPNALSTTASVIANAGCSGGATGNASATPTGGTLPYTLSWSNGISSIVTSSDTTGATLSAGTYTVTAQDNCGAMATASVTISGTITLTSTSVPAASATTCNGTASVTPSGGDAPYTYSWSASGQTASTATGLCADSSYCCTVTDHSGCMDSVCINITVSTGINNLTTDNGQVTVYPNPNGGIFTLSCHSERSEESLPIIEVYNVLGEKVLTETLRSAQPARTGTGGGDNLIDLSNKPDGVYLYRVISENGGLIGEGKIVIER